MAIGTEWITQIDLGFETPRSDFGESHLDSDQLRDHLRRADITVAEMALRICELQAEIAAAKRDLVSSEQIARRMMAAINNDDISECLLQRVFSLIEASLLRQHRDASVLRAARQV